MRRDMELVRKILSDISSSNVKMDFRFGGPKGKDNHLYVYHLEIMRDAGLINFNESKYTGGVLITPCPTLTWLGNDFYESIENDTLWNKVKDETKSKGLELTKLPFDIISSYAKLKAKEMLGIDI